MKPNSIITAIALTLVASAFTYADGPAAPARADRRQDATAETATKANSETKALTPDELAVKRARDRLTYALPPSLSKSLAQRNRETWKNYTPEQRQQAVALYNDRLRNRKEYLQELQHYYAQFQKLSPAEQRRQRALAFRLRRFIEDLSPAMWAQLKERPREARSRMLAEWFNDHLKSNPIYADDPTLDGTSRPERTDNAVSPATPSRAPSRSNTPAPRSNDMP